MKSLKEIIGYSRNALKELKENDFIQKDGSVVLPPNLFIDLLNGGAKELSCQLARINNHIEYHYHYKAIYRNTVIQTITENAIYNIV